MCDILSMLLDGSDVFAFECLLIIMRLWGFYRHTCLSMTVFMGRQSNMTSKLMLRIPYYLVANLLLSMVSSMCVNFGTLKFLEGIFIQLD